MLIIYMYLLSGESHVFIKCLDRARFTDTHEKNEQTFTSFGIHCPNLVKQT